MTSVGTDLWSVRAALAGDRLDRPEVCPHGGQTHTINNRSSVAVQDSTGSSPGSSVGSS